MYMQQIYISINIEMDFDNNTVLYKGAAHG